MAFNDDVSSAVQEVLDAEWKIRNGTVVPTTDGIVMRDEAVRLRATYAYADLAGSSKAAQSLKKEVTAKILRSYLNASTRILRHFGGEIRSFDGDRVMGIFVGGSKNTNAMKAAFGINWAVVNVIKPKLLTRWPTIERNYKISHGVGIDHGEALIVRGGVRSYNDLVSVGAAPNVAAKLSELRGVNSVYITRRTYDDMSETVKKRLDGSAFWRPFRAVEVGGKSYHVMAADYWRKP